MVVARITEIEFRQPNQLKMMHRLDPQLTARDAELEACDNDEDVKAIKGQIASREEQFKPIYL